MNIHSVAIPSAVEETVSAPFTPSQLVDKKTLTTNRFKGIPNKFIMTDRWESGTYLLLKVPMDGKYIPTQASKAKNAPIRHARLIEITDDEVDTVKVAAAMARVATLSMEEVKTSVATPIFANCPNRLEPKRHEAIKQEKTVPYGVALPAPKAFTTALLMAGGHCKTKMYMAASKRL